MISQTDLVTARAFREEDERDVLDLLSIALGDGPGGRRTREFFRWKHVENPFGRSYLLVAEAGGSIVGLRAFMRWRFGAGEGALRAVRAVDTATHPDHRGQGVFSALTRRALRELRSEADLVFNTPNERSLPGYLKMGWRIVGRMPVHIRPRRAVPVVREYLRHESAARPPRPRPSVGAESAADALADPGVPSLVSDAADTLDARLATPRDGAYLAWRYGSAPLLDYRAVRTHAGGRLTGIAVFRVRPRGSLWESTVADVIVRPGDRRSAGRLLRRVVVAAAVDHVSCSFPQGSAAATAARHCGFLRSPGGITLATNVVGEDVLPDPWEYRSWAVGLGDLEVF